jgi:hypothetical protein
MKFRMTEKNSESRLTAKERMMIAAACVDDWEDLCVD